MSMTTHLLGNIHSKDIINLHEYVCSFCVPSIQLRTFVQGLIVHCALMYVRTYGEVLTDMLYTMLYMCCGEPMEGKRVLHLFLPESVLILSMKI